MTYAEQVNLLVKTLAHLKPKRATLLVAIDGGGGAGKSTLARTLCERLDASMIQKDDFYLPSSELPSREESIEKPGSSFDWPRLIEQVLNPLLQGREARYQRFDWPTQRLDNWLTVPAGGIILIEGVYSSREELRPFYDFIIWVECSENVRVERGIARDGEHSRVWWVNDWLPAEQAYVKSNPQKWADFIVHA